MHKIIHDNYYKYVTNAQSSQIAPFLCLFLKFYCNKCTKKQDVRLTFNRHLVNSKNFISFLYIQLPEVLLVRQKNWFLYMQYCQPHQALP